MSTRCQIAVFDCDRSEVADHTDPSCMVEAVQPQALLYRHSDGYPDGPHGVVPFLARFLKAFRAHRGWDPMYLAAQLMAQLIIEHRQGQRDYHESSAPVSEITDQWDLLGHGIDRPGDIHGDIEFFYAICRDGVIVLDLWDRGMASTDDDGRKIMAGEVPDRYA